MILLEFDGLGRCLYDGMLNSYIGLNVKDVICPKCLREFLMASPYIIYPLNLSYFCYVWLLYSQQIN